MELEEAKRGLPVRITKFLFWGGIVKTVVGCVEIGHTNVKVNIMANKITKH